MSKEYEVLQKVTVFADLETIIKYHPASAAYQKETYSNDASFSKVIQIKPLLRKSKVEGEFKAKYIFPHTLELDLTAPHISNMLLMVHNMIEIDWGYYQEFLSDREIRNEAIAVLEELKSLFEILEEANSFKNNLGLVKKYSHVDKNGKKTTKSRSILEFNSREEQIEIIRILISKRQRHLNDARLSANAYNLIDYPVDLQTTKAALNIMLNDFRPFMARKVFRKSVIKVLRHYIADQSGFSPEKFELSDQNGGLIFQILCSFNLISLESEVNNVDPRAQNDMIKTYLTDSPKFNDKYFQFKSVSNHKINRQLEKGLTGVKNKIGQ